MARRDANRNPRRTLRSRPRILLLDRLQQQGPQTAPQLAESVQLHHNTVREHLDRLVDDGLVVREAERRTTRGRPRILFAAATGMDGLSARARAQTGRALALGEAYRHAYGLADPDEPDAAAAQLDVLEDYLDRCGFRPLVDRTALAVQLTCPFDELRGSLEQTVCRVDTEVMRSVLARADGPLEVTGLHPVEAEGTCVLRLIRRDADAAPAAATSCRGCPPDPRTSSAD